MKSGCRMHNDDREGKAGFVGEISALLEKDPRSGVEGVRYYGSYGNTLTEAVEILYTGGGMAAINVTGNSNGAILKEIANEVYGSGTCGRMGSTCGGIAATGFIN